MATISAHVGSRRSLISGHSVVDRLLGAVQQSGGLPAFGQVVQPPLGGDGREPNCRWADQRDGCRLDGTLADEVAGQAVTSPRSRSRWSVVPLQNHRHVDGDAVLVTVEVGGVALHLNAPRLYLAAESG